MKNRLFLVLLCLACLPGLAMALTIRGTVTDELSEPVAGATVLCKGTTLGTSTDLDGQFTLDVPDDAKTLVISYVGMLTQEVPVAPEVKVVMKENANNLDEVVVIGYGTVKKKDVLGSISTVKDKDLQDRTNGNILESMRGLTSTTIPAS